MKCVKETKRDVTHRLRKLQAFDDVILITLYAPMQGIKQF